MVIATRILLVSLLLLPATATAETADPPADAPAPDEAGPESTGEAEEAPAEVVVPGPWLWNRWTVALSYAQLGLLGTARTQVRAPMGRTPSIVFQNTYAGVGGQFAISPAFVEVGPRLSLAPIDVFDVDFGFFYTHTWRSSAGLLPYYGITGTLESQRNAIKDTAIAGHEFTLMVSPTVKLKVGPVIAIWNVEWAFIHHAMPAGANSPYVYEALRDMVVAWEDLVVTNIAGVLVEVLTGTGPKGGPGPRLRVGAITRDRQTAISRDIGTALGGVVSFKPGPKVGWPDIFLVVQGYLRDYDRQFKAPNVQLQFAWVLEKNLKRRSTLDDVADQVEGLKRTP